MTDSSPPPRRRSLRRVAIGVGLLVVLVGGYLGVISLEVVNGYAAKMLGSGIFVAERPPEAVWAQELEFLPFLSGEVDREAGRVEVSLLGLVPRVAIFRPGLGVTLLPGSGGSTAGPPALAPLPRPPDLHDLPWPLGERVVPAPPGYQAVQDRVHQAMVEPDPEAPRRTRAVVVVHQGRIVAEAYGEGFTAETPQVGWSMAKSVVNVLVGILVHRGRVNIQDRIPIPEWRDDERGQLTWDQLLRMSDGLEFSEEYYLPWGDAVQMLFVAGNAAGYAIARPLQGPVGQGFNYSSGTTTVLCRALRETMEAPTWYTFPREALFGPLGMYSAVLEVDAAGNFLGSSFLYATARDWARFGWLLAEDGRWQGQRILPEGWVEYCRRPTPTLASERYGAHFWLPGKDRFARMAQERRPLPPDTFTAAGHEEQWVTIVPSRELVVVRLGLTRPPARWDQYGLVADIVQRLPEPPAPSDE